MSEVGDLRFVGFCDEAPDGMRYACRAMGRDGYDIWTNGKSLFDHELRWAMVPRKLEGQA